MKKFQAFLFLSFLLILIPGNSFAQSIADELRQTLKLKPSLKIEELTDDYFAIKITEESLYSGMMPWIMGMSAMGQGGNEDMGKYHMFEARWTTGEINMIGGARYLVTYKIDMMSTMMLMGGGLAALGADQGAPKKMPTPTLTLELVNLENVKAISPMADLTPDQMRKSFEDIGSLMGLTGVSAGDSLSNIRQISLGLLMYSGDNEDIFPYVQSTVGIKFLLEPYLKNNEIWKVTNPNGGDIRFNMAIAGVRTSDIPNPADTVAFYETNLMPDGRRAVAFVDGHAKLLNAEEWEAAKATLSLKLKKSAKPLPADLGIGKI